MLVQGLSQSTARLHSQQLSQCQRRWPWHWLPWRDACSKATQTTSAASSMVSICSQCCVLHAHRTQIGFTFCYKFRRILRTSISLGLPPLATCLRWENIQCIQLSLTYSPALGHFLRLRPCASLKLTPEALCRAPGDPQAIRLPIRRGRRYLQGELPEVWEPGRQRQCAGPVRDRAPWRPDPDNLLHRWPPAWLHRRG